jgi:hypothetical protein
MTPSERLKGIENEIPKLFVSNYVKHEMKWLVKRIRQLEGAIELSLSLHTTAEQAQDEEWGEDLLKVRKALEENP